VAPAAVWTAGPRLAADLLADPLAVRVETERDHPRQRLEQVL